MRVLIAPDKFAGTLSAVEAAEAIADGWRRTAPDDEVTIAPLADGGPGFVDVLYASLGGSLVAATVWGPLGSPVPAAFLVVDGVAYIESAQACGLELLPVGTDGRTPEPDVATRASTYGVGELIGHAIDAGATRIVIGLGGSGTNDGGAGMLAALGATSEPPDALVNGAQGLAGLTGMDVAPALQRVGGIELVAASDVDNPLLGLRGATNVFGAQKGIASDEAKLTADGSLTRLADLVDRSLADSPGSGAAGGLGYGLVALGASRASGLTTVAEVVGLKDALKVCDIVLTGEGKLDWQTVGGKAVAGLAELAGAAMRPCVVLAGSVELGNRELRANGIEAAYSMIDVVGTEAAFAQPGESLARLAQRVAKTWHF